MDIVYLCGSLRKASFNQMLGQSLPQLAPAGVTIEAASPIGTLPLYNEDVQLQGFPVEVVALGDRIRRADGIILITPEYNFSFSGVLKNAIDWLSRLPDQPFKNKPVLLQSVSQGLLGGARAQYHLRQVLVFVEARVFNRPEVMVGGAKAKFDEATGQLSDGATRDVVRQQLAQFQSFVTTNAAY